MFRCPSVSLSVICLLKSILHAAIFPYPVSVKLVFKYSLCDWAWPEVKGQDHGHLYDQNAQMAEACISKVCRG